MSQSAHQRRSFRGEAVPATWSFRLVPLRFRNLHAPSSFTRVGLLGLQASEGMLVCKSEIFINFDFTPLTGPVGRAELHTFGRLWSLPIAALA
jgi:hypothetical protein